MIEAAGDDNDLKEAYMRERCLFALCMCAGSHAKKLEQIDRRRAMQLRREASGYGQQLSSLRPDWPSIQLWRTFVGDSSGFRRAGKSPYGKIDRTSERRSASAGYGSDDGQQRAVALFGMQILRNIDETHSGVSLAKAEQHSIELHEKIADQLGSGYAADLYRAIARITRELYQSDATSQNALESEMKRRMVAALTKVETGVPDSGPKDVVDAQALNMLYPFLAQEAMDSGDYETGERLALRYLEVTRNAESLDYSSLTLVAMGRSTVMTLLAQRRHPARNVEASAHLSPQTRRRWRKTRCKPCPGNVRGSAQGRAGKRLSQVKVPRSVSGFDAAIGQCRTP